MNITCFVNHEEYARLYIVNPLWKVNANEVFIVYFFFKLF